MGATAAVPRQSPECHCNFIGRQVAREVFDDVEPIGTAFLCTRYQEAVARLEDAVHRFEALGGSLWESASARMVLVFALYQMGSLEEAHILSERLYLQLEAAGYHFLADNVLTGWLMSSGGNVPDEFVQRARWIAPAARSTGCGPCMPRPNA